MRKPFLCFVMPVVLSLAACSGKGSPAAPSATTSTTSSSVSQATAGAVITGRVVSGSVSSVALAGTTVATATTIRSAVDASGQFTLTGVPTGDVQLQFAGPGSDARLSVSGITAREEIRLSVRVSGATAELDDNRRLTSDSRVEVEGKVAEINAGAGTMKVGDTPIAVPAGATITSNSGATIALSSIRVGDRVEVKGTMSGTTVTATSVKLESEPATTVPTTPTTPTTPPSTTTTVELTGTVLPTGRSGNCPVLTFAVGTTSITTSSATTYSDGTCASIVAGVTVEVKGTRQTNGSVLATSIEIDDAADDDEDDDNGGNNNASEIELEGRLTGKTGTCPLVTLTVGTTSVAANNSTRFDSSCSSINVNDKVKIKATRQPSGLPLATRVEKD